MLNPGEGRKSAASLILGGKKGGRTAHVMGVGEKPNLQGKGIEKKEKNNK